MTDAAHDRWPTHPLADRQARRAVDAASDTLVDAERLAAHVLAHADREAQEMISQARYAALRMTEQTRATIEEMFRVRHEEVLGLLAECRDEIRAALADSGSGHGAGLSDDSPAWAPRICSPTETPGTTRTDSLGASAILRTRPCAPLPPAHSNPTLHPSDEAYLLALYQAIAGTSDGCRDRPLRAVPTNHADQRTKVANVRAGRSSVHR